MAKSLSDIVGLVKKGDDNILEEQEKTNKTLESIDRNMKAFLDNARNSRLDDLEASREKKRPSGGGKGLIGGAALGAGASSAFNMASGDKINPIFAAALTAGAFKAISASTKLLKSALGSFRNGLADVNQRIRIIEADLNKRLGELDKANKARTTELEKIKADAEKARIAAETEKARLDKERASADNARQKRAIDERIRLAEAAEVDRIKAEKQRIADIETARKVADMERHNIERMKDAAAEAKAKKSFAKYKAMLRVEEGKAKFDEIERGTAKADRLNSTADRGLMNTADEVTARKLNATADRGLMNTADEVTARNLNATADRGLMETAERQKLVNDMGTAKTKRQRNAVIKKALATMTAADLAKLNLKPIMSSGQSGANRVMAATNMEGPRGFLPFDELEARMSGSPSGVSSGTSSASSRITAGMDGPVGGAKSIKGFVKGATSITAGTALGLVPGMDGFDALKGKGINKALGYLGLLLTFFDAQKGGRDATMDKAINEGEVITNTERTTGQTVGAITAFSDIPSIVKSGWLTYMPRFLGGASEDTSTEEIYKKAFDEGIAGAIATGGEDLGETLGTNINAILAALGRDEKNVALSTELRDLTKGMSGDATLSKEEFLKKYLKREADRANAKNKNIFNPLSATRMQFETDLTKRYEAGEKSGDFISQGFTKEQAAAFKANPDLFFDGGKSKAGSMENLMETEKRRRIDAAYLSSPEYKDTVAKGQELQKVYQQFIDTYEARLANSNNSGSAPVVVNNTNNIAGNGSNGSGQNNSTTSIDLNAGAVPGFAN